MGLLSSPLDEGEITFAFRFCPAGCSVVMGPEDDRLAIDAVALL